MNRIMFDARAGNAYSMNMSLASALIGKSLGAESMNMAGIAAG